MISMTFLFAQLSRAVLHHEKQPVPCHKPIQSLLSLGLLLSTFFLGSCGKEKAVLSGERIPLVSSAYEMKKAIHAFLPKMVTQGPFLPWTGWIQGGGNAHHCVGPFMQYTHPLQEVLRVNVSEPYELSTQPLVTHDRIYILSSKGVLICFNHAGVKQWSSPLLTEKSKGLGGGLALYGPRVYGCSAEGDMFAFDAGSGKKLWHVHLGAPCRSGPSLHVNKKDKSPILSVVTLKNEVFSIEGDSGKIRWKYKGIAEDAGLMGISIPVMTENMTIFATSSGEVTALLSADGSSIWTENGASFQDICGGPWMPHIKALPVIHEDSVYTISINGQMTRFALDSGRIMWTAFVSSRWTPVVIGEVIVCLTDSGHLAAFDRKTGGLFWQKSLPHGPCSDPVVVGSILYVLLENGELYGFDLKTKGVECQQYAIRAGGEGASLVVGPSGLYIVTAKGDLVKMVPLPRHDRTPSKVKK